MKVTQGAFSFLPELTDMQIIRQIEYALKNNWAISIEHTQYPHPRNCYWEMYGLPLFDIRDPQIIFYEIQKAVDEKYDHYVKVCCFNQSRGVESCALSFLVSRPWCETEFKLIRQETEGRNIRYTIDSI